MVTQLQLHRNHRTVGPTEGHQERPVTDTNGHSVEACKFSVVDFDQAVIGKIPGPEASFGGT